MKPHPMSTIMMNMLLELIIFEKTYVFVVTKNVDFDSINNCETSSCWLFTSDDTELK